jgi:hypothetical protein
MKTRQAVTKPLVGCPRRAAVAIHPGCGTNLATSGLLAGTFAWLVLRGRASTLSKMLRVPLALALGLVGFALSRPLGPVLQSRITTDADMGDLQVIDVQKISGGRIQTHRIRTRSR